jgi:CheY-like chemotaxis protein
MILIVEDDSTNMMIESKFVRMVRPRDLIFQFMDPGLCYRYFNSHPQELPEVIFCDFNMPVEDGYDVYKFFDKKGFKGDFYIVTCTDIRSIPDSLLCRSNVKLMEKPVLLKDFKKCLT